MKDTIQTEVNDRPDIGAIIDAGVARREAQRSAAQGATTEAERYAAALAAAADSVADELSATGVAPSSDAIFEAAGFTPSTETRMAALSAGRRIYADRAEALRQVRLAGESAEKTSTRRAIALAQLELDRVVNDPTVDSEKILAAVVALRRACGRSHAREAVTFAAAVELAVEKLANDD